MGGLKDKLPTTYWTMVIGSLALAGFPFTSGFFSKDEILVGAWNAGSFGKILAILGLITAGVTAFYSFRLIFVVFWGNSKVDPHHAQHIHEPSSTMTIPLIILAILSIAAGYLGISGFLDPVFGETEEHHGAVAMVIMGLATIVGLAGIGAAYFIYVQSPWLADRLANQWRQVYQLSLNKWYVDEAYDRTVVEPTFRMADRMWARIDVGMIDGAVNGVARAIAWWSWFMRLFQSGQTQHYALGMTLGAVLILTAYLLF
jgi:NADH-quinone oxidoreductase subunit L